MELMYLKLKLMKNQMWLMMILNLKFDDDDYDYEDDILDERYDGNRFHGINLIFTKH